MECTLAEEHRSSNCCLLDELLKLGEFNKFEELYDILFTRIS